jgi:hypothetical protein
MPLSLYDSYIKDVIGSFFLFFVVIGPVVYKTYIATGPSEEEKREEEEAKY